MSRIGVVADGKAEVTALREVLQRIESEFEIIAQAAYADMQPKSTAGQIARSAEPKVRALASSRKLDKVVVIIDREDRDECPCKLARDIENALMAMVEVEIYVVIKDRQLENWLIADLKCLKKMKARFKIGAWFSKCVAPNKADRQSAPQQLLDRAARAAKGREYHKLEDARKILALADPVEIARNSRSFRRFLRVLGSGLYKNQSAVPAEPHGD